MFRRKEKNPDAIQVLAMAEQMLLDECIAHSHELEAASRELPSNWERKILYESHFILSLTRGREMLKRAMADAKHGKDWNLDRIRRQRFQISSLFLRESWEYLRSDPGMNERLHLVTGTITGDGTKVLSRMERVRFEKQGSVYVSLDKTDSHRKMMALEAHGHALLAVFHSHIARGAAATTPSSIDMAFLERIAKLGGECLGAIFSLDGYARFFMKDKDFAVEVYGNGVIKVEENSSHKIFKVLEGGRQ